MEEEKEGATSPQYNYTAKMTVLNQPATWLLARADSLSAC